MIKTIPNGKSEGIPAENYFVLSGDQLQSIVQRTVTNTLR